MTTQITPEFLYELERGLEGVTPGPWKADQANSRKYLDAVEFSYLSGMKGSVSLVGPKHACVGASELDEQNANSAHIARCDPDTIRALIAALREAWKVSALYRVPPVSSATSVLPQEGRSDD